jgi:predicted nucleic acid-binding Zn ribbon protein
MFRTEGSPVSRGKGRPERVQDLLGDFLEREGVAEDLARQSALEEWAESVGPRIAQVTRARSVADSTLVVEVRSSPWLMELNMMKREILERLNQDRTVPVEKLVFVMSPE